MAEILLVWAAPFDGASGMDKNQIRGNAFQISCISPVNSGIGRIQPNKVILFTGHPIGHPARLGQGDFKRVINLFRKVIGEAIDVISVGEVSYLAATGLPVLDKEYGKEDEEGRFAELFEPFVV